MGFVTVTLPYKIDEFSWLAGDEPIMGNLFDI
jgi:hypothetical protein